MGRARDRRNGRERRARRTASDSSNPNQASSSMYESFPQREAFPPPQCAHRGLLGLRSDSAQTPTQPATASRPPQQSATQGAHGTMAVTLAPPARPDSSASCRAAPCPTPASRDPPTRAADPGSSKGLRARGGLDTLSAERRAEELTWPTHEDAGLRGCSEGTRQPAWRYSRREEE